MRQKASDFGIAENARMYRHWEAVDVERKQNNNTPQSPAMNRAWQQGNIEDENARRQFSLEIAQNYVGLVVQYKDELIRRLGPQKPPMPMEQFNLLWGPYANPAYYSSQAVAASAQYLENLARKLPGK
jgi:hypothetical protein